MIFDAIYRVSMVLANHPFAFLIGAIIGMVIVIDSNL